MPRKGFLFARIATPWGELDVYAAHTLADYRETKYRMLRMTELFELAEGVRELSAGRPFVILGDLNSGHGDPEFDLFLSLLGLADPCAPEGREQCGDPRRPKRIDHVLVPAGRPGAKAARVFDEALSDHPGVAVDLPRALISLRASPDPKEVLYRSKPMRITSRASTPSGVRIAVTVLEASEGCSAQVVRPQAATARRTPSARRA